MCSVSFIGDGWQKTFPNTWPQINTGLPLEPQVTKFEFEKLRVEVQELRKLLEAAKEFDIKTGQPDCEMDDKVAFIKKIAEFVGVNMDDVFGTSKKPGKGVPGVL